MMNSYVVYQIILFAVFSLLFFSTFDAGSAMGVVTVAAVLFAVLSEIFLLFAALASLDQAP